MNTLVRTPVITERLCFEPMSAAPAVGVTGAGVGAPGQAVPIAVAVPLPQAAAVTAAPTTAVAHWSGVHVGAQFSFHSSS